MNILLIILLLILKPILIPIQYTENKQSYHFYNKLTLYNKYNSIPGVYYLNFLIKILNLFLKF